MPAIDNADFAKACVLQGLNCGINPHYLLGVAEFRSGISDYSQNGEIGPFRLTQAEWDAHRVDDEFAFDFESNDINDWDMQCAVFALMAHRAFDAFASQQWPDAATTAAATITLSNGLQKALDATAPLLGPATSALPNAAPSVPAAIVDPNQPTPPAVMGPVLKALKDANQQRLQTLSVDKTLVPKLNSVAARLIAPAAKQRYQGISATTQVPWFVIAVIHEREASQSFTANLAQGDPFDKVSVNVPAGRGPFASFEAAAVDALSNCAPFAARWKDWTFSGALTLLEQYNGLGYARRGIPSPYIWASTNQYIKGKFTSDHHFDPNAVDHQLGCAALLSQMKVADPTIPL
jgi:lysozyme family protein